MTRIKKTTTFEPVFFLLLALNINLKIGNDFKKKTNIKTQLERKKCYPSVNGNIIIKKQKHEIITLLKVLDLVSVKK